MQSPSFKQLSLSFLLIVASTLACAEPVKVLTSIKPLQLIAQAITDGVSSTEVLLPPGNSPHSYSLKPSDARKLRDADVIFWIGPSMEAFLPKMLSNAKGTKAVSMMDLPGIQLRRMEEHDDHHDHHDHHGHKDLDAHIWLSTENARVMAGEIARVLTSLDAANKAKYSSNLKHFLQSMNEVDTRNEKIVEQSGNKPFFVFHDAYGYLEDQYDLRMAGYFTLNPAQQPGARHLVVLQQELKKAGASCVFREPQFEPAYIDRLTDGLSIKVGVLDPLAGDIEPGADSYAAFIKQLVDNIVSCSGGKTSG